MEPEVGPAGSPAPFRAAGTPRVGCSQPPTCFWPLSLNPLFSPFTPGLWRPGGVGGELSGATMPAHQWTKPRQQPGLEPASCRPDSASPLCRPHQVFGGGEPQSHSEKGSRGQSSLGPCRAGSRPPSPSPGHLEKAHLTHGTHGRRLSLPPLRLLPNSLLPVCKPVCVTLALGLLS